ncbi:hypothetical protein Lal_00013228 [Lupinus albus]|nr:hypothetical protein Lal_00013228 [Lupinus albus]
MAGHSESGSSEKKSSNGLNELLTLNAENLQSNMKIIYYSRTFLSIIGGVVAGILGFTGLKGFVFYFFLMAVTSIGLLAKAKFSIHTYFDSWNRVLLDGFLSGLMYVEKMVESRLREPTPIRRVYQIEVSQIPRGREGTTKTIGEMIMTYCRVTQVATPPSGIKIKKES